MSPVLTRRCLVQAGAVTLGTMVAGPSVTAEATPNPDAGLLKLLAQEDEARRAWCAASDALDAASDRELRSRPPRPEALRSDLRDHWRGLGAAAGGKVQLPNGSYKAFWRDEDVEALKRAPLPTRWAVGDADDQPRSELDPDGEVRRREIITAYDAWRAERRVVEDAVGLTAATIADDEVGRALTIAEDAIEAYRARTVPGLAAKAAWVADRLDSDVMETTLAPLVHPRGRGIRAGDVVTGPAVFDAAAFVTELVALDCKVYLTWAGGPAGFPRRVTYSIGSPDGRGFGESFRVVMERWHDAMEACPDHVGQVVAYLTASGEASS